MSATPSPGSSSGPMRADASTDRPSGDAGRTASSPRDASGGDPRSRRTAPAIRPTATRVSGDATLRRDLRLLTTMLRAIVFETGSGADWQEMESLHQLAAARHAGGGDGPGDALTRLADELSQRSDESILKLVRALGAFFDLANVAEDRQRIRVLIDRRSQGTLDETIADAPAAGPVEAELVLTAHPTEAKRRTIRTILKRLRRHLMRLDETSRAKRRPVLAAIRHDLRTLWLTDALRPSRPTVLQELDRAMYAIRTLWQVVPQIRQALRTATGPAVTATADQKRSPSPAPLTRAQLIRQASRPLPPGPAAIRFGCWIGGDRDGHPFVTTDVTAETLRRLRKQALALHLDECRESFRRLSYSSDRVPALAVLQDEVEARLKAHPALAEADRLIPDDEVIRRYLALVESRLVATRDRIDEFASVDDLFGSSPQPGKPTGPSAIDFRRVAGFATGLSGSTEAAAPGSESRVAGYATAAELDADVGLLDHLLRTTDSLREARPTVRAWRDRIATFGFHLMRLDVRQNSVKLAAAVGELHDALAARRFVAEGTAETRERTPLRAWAELSEDERRAALTIPPGPDVRQILTLLSEETLDLVRLMAHLHRIRRVEPSALGGLIISMTHQVSDVLTMLWLWQVGDVLTRPEPKPGDAETEAVTPPVAIVPLLETIDDLAAGGRLVETLLSVGPYREHVRRSGDEQQVMVGYSDGTKDGGYVAAQRSLYVAQQDLATVAETHGVSLTIFHGRGGALGRGGGPAVRAIEALPPAAVRGRLRMTEQGEVIAERFDDPMIAHRYLEQVLHALKTVTSFAPSSSDADVRSPESSDGPPAHSDGQTGTSRLPGGPPAGGEALLERFASRAREAYLALRDHPAFVRYLRLATPIEVIENLPIGSRPSRRTGTQTLADLRAIPFTFAWTQSRQLLTAFYGLGTAWRGLTADDQAAFVSYYQQWPVIRSMIDNAMLALAKCDMDMARQYADLAEESKSSSHEGEPGLAEIFDAIESEYTATTEAVLAITGQTSLLEAVPWLRRAVTLRNPYVDLLNLAQIELLRRRRAGSSDTPSAVLEAGLRESVQAIAAGLRNTG